VASQKRERQKSFILQTSALPLPSQDKLQEPMQHSGGEDHNLSVSQLLTTTERIGRLKFVFLMEVH
jgi:hypothetical protein